MKLRFAALLLLFSPISLFASASVELNSRQLFNFRRQDENTDSKRVRPCTTPSGDPGLCQDVTNCPALLLDLRSLVRSICFQSLFRPGTCCPLEVSSPTKKLAETTTFSPTVTTDSAVSTKKQTGFKKVTAPGKRKPSTPASAPSSTRPPPTTTKASVNKVKSTKRPDRTTKRPLIEDSMKPPPFYPNPSNVLPGSKRYGCGVHKVTQARIVNGTESYPGQWPWMAAIYLYGFLGSEFHCGGTLISRDYVVTAAHCMIDKRGKRFSPSQFSVRLGDHDISSTTQRADKYAVTMKVQSVKIHDDFENFNHQYFRNDIALLKLTRSVEFSPFVLPICLPSKAMSRAHIDALSGETTTVIGYGRVSYSGPQSKKLLRAEMPVWWNKACDDAYFPPILETNICAGYVEGGIDSCQGDSGGPLLIHRHNKWVLLGIVSFGQKCAEPGYPGVYTRVPKFLNWIQEMARN